MHEPVQEDEWAYVRDYLESLVVEQINRALALKSLIHYPLNYPELTGLASRSTGILDEQIDILKSLQLELHGRPEDDLRDIFRDMRICSNFIALVEYYGISALYYQTPEIGFLNKLIFKISQEIKLPFPHPSVCCTGTMYYFSHPFTNVIFTPLTEAQFLLHMPDLYHEIGHCVLENMKSELRMKSIQNSYEASVSRVTDYYAQLIKNKRDDVGPEQISMVVERLHSHWKSWIIEFFCDLFALFTVGPAYAWSHLHLTMKRSVDIHEISMIQQMHPSDESRMRILLIGLGRLGFENDAERIRSKWSEAARFWGTPETEYQYAYPDALLEDIVGLIIDGLKLSGVSVFPSELSSKSDDEIRILLNEAWQVFWDSEPEDFRNWEQDRIENLRNSMQVIKATQSAS